MCNLCKHSLEASQDKRFEPNVPISNQVRIETPVRGFGNSLAQSGWQCPVCGQGCAPFLSVCPCSQRSIVDGPYKSTA